jgi:hypothetical protein
MALYLKENSREENVLLIVKIKYNGIMGQLILSTIFKKMGKCKGIRKLGEAVNSFKFSPFLFCLSPTCPLQIMPFYDFFFYCEIFIYFFKLSFSLKQLILAMK